MHHLYKPHFYMPHIIIIDFQDFLGQHYVTTSQTRFVSLKTVYGTYIEVTLNSYMFIVTRDTISDTICFVWEFTVRIKCHIYKLYLHFHWQRIILPK